MAKPFMSGYKTYEGERGNARSWSSAFQGRLGFEEAEAIIHGQEDTPRGLLGVGLKATWAEIKSAYRAKSMQCHPDLCSQHGMTVAAATEAFKKLTAAYTVLEREFGQ